MADGWKRRVHAEEYTAQSILAAASASTPVALTVAASRIVGRKSTGDIAALTGAEVITLTGAATNVLDNLGATAINANLMPAADDTIDAGDDTHRFHTIWSRNFLATQSFQIYGTNNFTVALGTAGVQFNNDSAINSIVTISREAAGALGIRSTDLTAETALRFKGRTSGYVGLITPATVTTYSLILPSATGTGALSSDGAGNFIWGNKDSIFTVYNSADTTKILALSAAGIATGTTRTWTVLDVSGVIQPMAYAAKSVAGSSDVTLTAAEAAPSVLKFTGALTGNISVILPLTSGREWIVWNATSGAYTLTVIGASGTGTAVTQGKKSIVWTDATNFYVGLDDVSSGGAVSSVFTRTGAVVAATNDYTWAQIDKSTSDIADLTTRAATSLTMATARLLGRTTAAAGAVEEITVGGGLSLAAGTLTALIDATRTWATLQIFPDNKIQVCDDGDNSKALTFQVSGVSASTTRIWTVLDVSGPIQPMAYGTKSVAGSSDVTLTAVEAAPSVVKLTGALTGNISVILPLTSGRAWTIWNATSGAFKLTVIGSSGAGVDAKQGFKTLVWTDATDFFSGFDDPLPATDNAVDIGSTTYRWKNVKISGAFSDYATVGDTVEQSRLGLTSLSFGAGGSTPLDATLSRPAADVLAVGAGDTLRLQAAAGISDEIVKDVTTTNVIATVIWSQALSDDTTYTFEVYVVALRTDAGDESASYIRRATYKRRSASGIVQVGATTSETNEDTAAWDAGFNINANTLEFKVTGQAGKTIKWTARIKSMVRAL